MSETLEKFLNRVAEAAEQSTLVKMTLSKPAQKHDELRNIYVKPVLIKEKRLFALTYHYERRDEVKNYDVTQMLDMLREMIPNRFLNAEYASSIWRTPDHAFTWSGCFDRANAAAHPLTSSNRARASA